MTGRESATPQAGARAVSDAEQMRAEATRVLDELTVLVRDGVPGCDGVSVSLFHDGTPSSLAATDELVRVLDAAQYTRDEGPCVTAMRQSRTVRVADCRAETRWPGIGEDFAASGMRSSLSLPLDEAGRTLGGLNLYASTPGAFTDASLRAAQTFARQAVLMLGSLQKLHYERAAHAREHDVAAALQRSLLPALPELAGITCAARYLVSDTRAQVGGDWYDVFALPDGAIGVAIGDVMGHDVAAAAAMGQLRSVLRSYAYEGSSPSVVLDRLDRLVQGFEMAQLATAIYGRLILDADTALFVFSNAGHLPPLVRHPDGSVHRLDRGASPPIGAQLPGVHARTEAAVVLPPGALLLLYTDGLIETRDRDIDERIASLCAALRALPPAAAPEQVCDALLGEFAGGEHDDDIAVLAVRIDIGRNRGTQPDTADAP